MHNDHSSIRAYPSNYDNSYTVALKPRFSLAPINIFASLLIYKYYLESFSKVTLFIF